MLPAEVTAGHTGGHRGGRRGHQTGQCRALGGGRLTGPMSSPRGHVLLHEDLHTRKHRAQGVAQSLRAPKSLEDKCFPSGSRVLRQTLCDRCGPSLKRPTPRSQGSPQPDEVTAAGRVGTQPGGRWLTHVCGIHRGGWAVTGSGDVTHRAEIPVSQAPWRMGSEAGDEAQDTAGTPRGRPTVVRRHDGSLSPAWSGNTQPAP